MKRNNSTILIGIVLAIIFAFLLFTFKVRQTEVALVTTFGKPTRNINEGEKNEAGLYLKMPWPIQKVVKFDKRVYTFEDKYSETPTRDARNIMITVYAGWRISNPKVFRERFNGSITQAEGNLETLLRTAKSAVVGQHPFADFISTSQKDLHLGKIEEEMLKQVQSNALETYGIEVQFLGIKQLGLPESVTQAVFNRMKEERQRHVSTLQSEGESRASAIRVKADSEKNTIIADAEARAIRIRGEADAVADKSYAILEKNPELASLLMKLTALELISKERTTLILDSQTPPFDIFKPKSTVNLGK